MSGGIGPQARETAIDVGVRQRLTARFGSEVEAWSGELPGVLTALAESRETGRSAGIEALLELASRA